METGENDRLATDSMLSELGWTVHDLGRVLGVHRNTPLGWVGDLPSYARAYLELAVRDGRRGVEVEALRCGVRLVRDDLDRLIGG